jgi:RimJ/RimL family protein N-acetyltransferase
MISGSDGQQDALPSVWVLSDGAALWIRAVQPEDVARLERLFYRLSPASIASYFFLPVPQLPHWAARLAEVAQADGVEHGALVALLGEEIVGVARSDRITPEEAEFGLLIEDGWQGRGLGKRMLGMLIQDARRQGIRTFRAYIQGENRRALRLVGALFATVHPQWYGRECLIQAPTAALRPVCSCDG